MGQAGGDPDLAEKPLRLVARPGHRPEHLDRHLPAVLQVFGQVDGRGTPAADLLVDAIAVREEAAEQGRLRGVGSHPGKVHASAAPARQPSG